MITDASTVLDDGSIDAMRRLVGASITSFGMNAHGEIFLTTSRGHEFVIGKDELGDISLYEIERTLSGHQEKA